MKKTKILLGALTATAIAPAMPMMLTSCGNNNSFAPTVTKDENIKSYETSAAELNRAFAVYCVCNDNYELDTTNTSVTIGNTLLKLDTDYIIYNDMVIIGSAAIIDKNVNINLVSKAKDIPATEFSATFYANYGQFSGEEKQVIIATNVAKGTKLKDIPGYEEPTYGTGNQFVFSHWLDAKNNVYTKDSEITQNTVLSAQFEEPEQTPADFKTDNWTTMVKACASATTFVKYYLDSTFAGTEEEAIVLVNNEIKLNATDPENTKLPDRKIYIWLYADESGEWQTKDVTIRLVGCGIDKSWDSTDTKTNFTFEFVDSIDVLRWDMSANNHWATYTSETELESSTIRTYCNDYLVKYMPGAIIKNAKTVRKSTCVPKNDYTEVETRIETPELLFPLASEEYGIGSGMKNEKYLGTALYPYYQQFKDISVTTHNTKKYLGEEDIKAYWMRSPRSVFSGSFSGARKYSKVLAFQGSAVAPYYTDQTFAIAPAFCL